MLYESFCQYCSCRGTNGQSLYLFINNGHLSDENYDYLGIMSQYLHEGMYYLGGYMMASHHGRLWFNPEWYHMIFVVDEVALKRISLSVSSAFPC
jgi:hypothetical protein